MSSIFILVLLGLTVAINTDQDLRDFDFTDLGLHADVYANTIENDEIKKKQKEDQYQYDTTQGYPILYPQTHLAQSDEFQFFSEVSYCQMKIRNLKSVTLKNSNIGRKLGGIESIIDVVLFINGCGFAHITTFISFNNFKVREVFKKQKIIQPLIIKIVIVDVNATDFVPSIYRDIVFASDFSSQIKYLGCCIN